MSAWLCPCWHSPALAQSGSGTWLWAAQRWGRQLGEIALLAAGWVAPESLRVGTEPEGAPVLGAATGCTCFSPPDDCAWSQPAPLRLVCCEIYITNGGRGTPRKAGDFQPRCHPQNQTQGLPVIWGCYEDPGMAEPKAGKSMCKWTCSNVCLSISPLK